MFWDSKFCPRNGFIMNAVNFVEGVKSETLRSEKVDQPSVKESIDFISLVRSAFRRLN